MVISVLDWASALPAPTGLQSILSHLYMFQHPNQSAQGKPLLGKRYELPPPSAISEADMAICTASKNGSEKGQVNLQLPIKSPLYTMPVTCRAQIWESHK